MWLWEKTHHIIADYLRLLVEKNWSVSDGDVVTIQESMETTMQQEFQLAKNRQYNRYDKDNKFWFKEFCYGDDISDQLEDGIVRVLWNLDALRASDLHDTLLHYAKSGYKLYIESNESDFEQMKLVLDHHPILQDVTIWAGPDFGVTATDNTYYIYDRKSGTEKDIPQDTITDQLKIYAYKLLCNTNRTLENTTIYTYEVYLPSMYMIGGKVNQTDIDHIKQKVIDDVHELQTLVVDGNIKNNIPEHVDSFQRTADSAKCRLCSMRRVCATLKKIDGDNHPNPILDTLAGELDSGRLF